ncbi:MAG TPA: 1-deoxy-D-xylulose-5-phosphate reductoisomerase [Mycobacteriales bacterium]|nr:1-deoxy-D-xylulose-5-phosphate reductoisomerase [Mycobacteriales bacterium]
MLGSTGSIGTQALDVIGRNAQAFRVYGIAAGGSDPKALAAQALATGAEVIAVAQASAGEDVLLALYAEAQRRGYARGEFRVPAVLTGPDAAAELAGHRVDVCLNGITGSIGLAPTLAALRAGSTLALANKESLITGSELVFAARVRDDQIVPVDSEHSAMAQCLRSGQADEVSRIILTASGGPFRGRRRNELTAVTVEQAMAHPTWNMGPVITINSATLVNKGLELIETHLLFDVPYERIDVVVHPQSLVHSMVEFSDGSTIAQVSPPDMRLPIAHALAWPGRVPGAAPTFDWRQPLQLQFEPLDADAFPAVSLARYAGEQGGLAPCAFNAANEIAVDAFVRARIPFLGIVETVSRVVEETVTGRSGVQVTLASVQDTEAWARARARELTSTGAD